MYNEGVKTLKAYGALAARVRVKIKSGTTSSPPEVEVAGAGEQHVGFTEYAVADGDLVAVRLITSQGTQEAVASKSFAKGAVLYGAASGKVSDASSGSAIGEALESATADGDIVEILHYTVKSTTAATVSILDSGGFTGAATVEAALAEIYQHVKTAKAFIPVYLMSLREATNFNVGNIAANGGVLASDTTPVLSAINGATDGCQRVLWAAANSDQVIAQIPLPADLDATGDIKVHVRAAMGGTTNTPDIALDSFFDEGDTKVQDTIAAITGTSYDEYVGTIAAADVPDGARTLTIGLTPGAHTTDTLAISAIWIEYQRKALTS